MEAFEFFRITRNQALLAALIAYFAAQSLKVILTLIMHRRFDIRRFIGAGGMPSSHAAMVCATATTIGFNSGFDSSVFALSVVIALVIMYDASGVRRAAGKTAAALNRIVETLIHEGVGGVKPEYLKELIGHTPLEVFAGAFLGIVIGILMV